MLLETGEPLASALAPWAKRHLTALTTLLVNHSQQLRPTFEAINSVAYKPAFDDAVVRARNFLQAIAP